MEGCRQLSPKLTGPIYEESLIRTLKAIRISSHCIRITLRSVLFCGISIPRKALFAAIDIVVIFVLAGLFRCHRLDVTRCRSSRSNL